MSDNELTPEDPADDVRQADDVPAQPADLGHVSPAAAVPGPRTPADDDGTLAALRDASANLVALNERIRKLEEEKAARDRADAAAASEVWVHPNTHVLVLSNGDTVETANPSTTHFSTEDGIFPVVSRHVINPE